MSNLLSCNSNLYSVAVCRTTLYHQGLTIPHTKFNKSRFHGLAKSATAHGCHFRRHTDNVNVPYAEQLHLDDFWLPIVRNLDLACIEKNRLWFLAFSLILAGCLQNVRNHLPKEISVCCILCYYSIELIVLQCLSIPCLVGFYIPGKRLAMQARLSYQQLCKMPKINKMEQNE